MPGSVHTTCAWMATEGGPTERMKGSQREEEILSIGNGETHRPFMQFLRGRAVVVPASAVVRQDWNTFVEGMARHSQWLSLLISVECSFSISASHTSCECKSVIRILPTKLRAELAKRSSITVVHVHMGSGHVAGFRGCLELLLRASTRQ